MIAKQSIYAARQFMHAVQFIEKNYPSLSCVTPVGDAKKATDDSAPKPFRRETGKNYCSLSCVTPVGDAQKGG